MAWLGRMRATAAAALVVFAFAAFPASAADDGSARRIVTTKGADYFGRDYNVLRNVGLPECSAACVADRKCQAFTFNDRSRWCFLKDGVGELRTVAGAISGRIVQAPAVDANSIAARAKELDFLPQASIDAANRMRLSLAGEDRAPTAAGQSVADIADRARSALTSQGAVDLWREVLKREPLDHGAWAALAAAALANNPQAFEDQQANNALREAAAINAYLTASSDAARASALGDLGRVYEAAENWKRAIRAYRHSIALAADGSVQSRLDQAVAAHGFRIVDQSVDNNAANPRICLTFSDALSAKLTSSENPGDYLSVENGETLPVTASGNQMCVEGVQHGTRYHIVARPGIASADGETLQKQADLSIYVKDRDPSVRFATNAYVLPAGGNATIPVTTINTGEIEASVQRIGPRGLTDLVGNERFLRELSEYQIQDITDQSGEKVWTGKVDVARDLNQEIVTAIPVAAIAPDMKPGIYVLTAKAKNGPAYQDTAATQWFVVSDIGLSTFAASDGFHVFARSLSSAAPLAGASLDLVAVNNQILGTATTDSAGHARFPAGLLRGTGGNRPAILTAIRDPSDFVFLDLTASPFDLTDRGVDGRPPAGPLDVFLTPERGIYRAGDTAYLTAMTRDSQGQAITGLSLSEIVTRPDGVEFSRSQVRDLGAGGYSFPVALPKNAMRGVWKVALHTDPKQPALAETSFRVEDFEPQKIDFDLTTEAKVLDPASPPVMEVAAHFLFGAPAGGLEVDGEAVLTSSAALDGFPGYSFGLATDDTTAARQPFETATTDEAGKTSIALPAFDAPVTTRPLVASMRVRVVDAGGRPVERTMDLPLAGAKPRLGIKPRFDGTVSENATAGFDLIAIDADRSRTGLSKAAWVLNKVTTRFQWYRTTSGWNYEPVRSSTRVASGTVDIGADAPATLNLPVEWGEYELTLSDPAGKAVPASVTFDAGWYVATTSVDTPDVARVSLDKARYRIGDTATVHIEPRFAGKAEILVMDERVIATRTADIPAAGGDVTLAVTRDWGPGAYIAAVVYRPMNLDQKRMPGRAIGLAHASVDPGDRALTVAIGAPEKIRPRRSVDIGLTVGGVKPGETAYVTLAAVDVGILNITGFQPPSPKGYYFGKRRLGVEIRDLYSKLIDRMAGAPGTVRSGGDAGASYETPPPMDDLVARYSGPVTVGEDGKATIPLDIPDFNGTLKLMAMAWSKTGVGEASADMTVRDPIVVAVSRPRFLAPGDTSRIAIDVTHVEGPTGAAHVALSGGAGLVKLGPGAEATLDLTSDGRKRMLVPVTATAIGDAEFDVALTMPGGETLEKHFGLPVRSIAPGTVDRSTVTLAANGGRLTLDPDLFAGFVPGTGKATLSITGAADFDVAGVVRALDRYPYGCTEQITSRALPLVYLDRTILAVGLTGEDDVKKRVDDAIAAVLANQSSSGSFGLWGPDSGDLWLDAYVTDFLTRAREAGYAVPQEGFTLAIDNLRNTLAALPDAPDWGPVAYAYYVLARNGRAAIGDLRYYVDNQVANLPTPLAKAQMAAALALYGDRTRAETVFRMAVEEAESGATPNAARTDYGTPLRDNAAVLTLGLETAVGGVPFDGLVKTVNAEWRRQSRTSTQEDTWSLLAAHALLDRNPPKLTVAGRDFVGPYAAAFDAETLSAGLDIANRDAAPVAARLTLRGVPEVPPPASSDGYAISRSYYTLDGQRADPSKIGQGDRLVAVVEMTPLDTGPARLMIDDPLPAGLEIDNPAILKGGDVAALDWLELTGEAKHTEFRADRFLAAVDQGADDTQVRRFAYIVRAVSPGRFAHPAAVVENMYDPSRRGRTDAGTVSVIGPLR
ncbi:MG2 domain-containing protein [Jiella sp. M17.18]|uniref:MG2 domain-containing protein n=1 Tax=Jiella sp. M17.18 TaxID=3234247 RepID=UPI0034DDE596